MASFTIVVPDSVAARMVVLLRARYPELNDLQDLGEVGGQGLLLMLRELLINVERGRVESEIREQAEAYREAEYAQIDALVAQIQFPSPAVP